MIFHHPVNRISNCLQDLHLQIIDAAERINQVICSNLSSNGIASEISTSQVLKKSPRLNFIRPTAVAVTTITASHDEVKDFAILLATNGQKLILDKEDFIKEIFNPPQNFTPAAITDQHKVLVLVLKAEELITDTSTNFVNLDAHLFTTMNRSSSLS